MKYIILSLSFLSFLIISGCATILNGSKQDVQINSDPSGAKVYVNNTYQGETPLTKSMERKSENIEIKIKLDGYKTYSLNLRRNFNGTTLVNIVLGGIIGIGIDAATGAMYKLDPSTVRADLEEKNEGFGSINEDGTYIYVKLINKSDKTIKKIGNMEKQR